MVDRLLLITLGATIRDALLVVLFANVLSSAVIILNGRAAATYHIGYPVLSRVSFGIYGQYIVVVLRALLSIIWGFAYPFLIKEFNLLIYLSVVQGGIQLYYEGQFISICLRGIFSGWSRIHNGIPEVRRILKNKSKAPLICETPEPTHHDAGNGRLPPCIRLYHSSHVRPHNQNTPSVQCEI